MDFMGGSATGIAGSRAAISSDNMQMKCGPGSFEMDEFGRPKSAKIEKTVSYMFGYIINILSVPQYKTMQHHKLQNN